MPGTAPTDKATESPLGAEIRSLVALAYGEEPEFKIGETLRVMTRSPIAHYRVPQYLRGHIGVVEAVIHPEAVDNEEEAFGRNAGSKGHYYRLAFRMADIWPVYADSKNDSLRIEVFQTWLERA